MDEGKKVRDAIWGTYDEKANRRRLSRLRWPKEEPSPQAAVHPAEPSWVRFPRAKGATESVKMGDVMRKIKEI